MLSLKKNRPGNSNSEKVKIKFVRVSEVDYISSACIFYNRILNILFRIEVFSILNS